MTVHQRIDNKFKWLPDVSSVERIDTESINDNIRNPIFWLKRQDNALYFINSSSEVLDLVIANSFRSNDDKVTDGLFDKSGYFYDRQAKNQAVKIFDFEQKGENTASVSLCLKVKSKHHGELKITFSANEGGLYPLVLLWSTGEVGKGIEINKMTY